MKSRFQGRALVLASLAAFLAGAPIAAAPAPAPPPTRVAVVTDTIHGIPIEDPYRWLEDKDSPETREWVRAQMSFTQQQLEKIPGRDEVLAILARHGKVDTRTVPILRGRRLFFTARSADQQQPVIVMRETADSPDVVLVDPNPLSTDGNTSVSLLNVSRDGKLLVYGLRKGGEDEVELKLYDVEKRADTGESLPRARYQGVSIDKLNKGFWYGRWSREGTRILYHRLGSDPAKDPVVFGEGLGPEFIPSARVSPNGRWLLLTVSKGSASDDTKLYLKNLESNGPIVTVADTLHSNLSMEMAGDQLVIETNWGAPNRRVFLADAKKPQPANWKVVIPESPDAVIEDVSPVGGLLYVTVLKEVTSRLRVYPIDGGS
jgi:prolyl oligopeptidase